MAYYIYMAWLQRSSSWWKVVRHLGSKVARITRQLIHALFARRCKASCRACLSAEERHRIWPWTTQKHSVHSSVMAERKVRLRRWPAINCTRTLCHYYRQLRFRQLSFGLHVCVYMNVLCMFICFVRRITQNVLSGFRKKIVCSVDFLLC